MDIVLSTDNNYIQHCAVTMVSILNHNHNVNLYLLTEGLSQDNVQILSTLVENLQGNLKIVTIPSQWLDRLPMPKDAAKHVSVATYNRLFISEVLPQEIDEVVYMDCDIVVRRSLSDLWEEDLNGFALGAVYQQNEPERCKKLNIPTEFGYFNAGVLLINLKFWRNNQINNKCISYIRNNSDLIVSHDQDVLNAVLFDKTKAISCDWNMLGIFFSNKLNLYTFPQGLNYHNIVKEVMEAGPSVVHFVSRPKPWEYACRHPFRKDYYFYLAYTPWKNWRPKIKVKNIIFFRLIPMVITIKRKILCSFSKL